MAKSFGFKTFKTIDVKYLDLISEFAGSIRKGRGKYTRPLLLFLCKTTPIGYRRSCRTDDRKYVST